MTNVITCRWRSDRTPLNTRQTSVGRGTVDRGTSTSNVVGRSTDGSTIVGAPAHLTLPAATCSGVAKASSSSLSMSIRSSMSSIVAVATSWSIVGSSSNASYDTSID